MVIIYAHLILFHFFLWKYTTFLHDFSKIITLLLVKLLAPLQKPNFLLDIADIIGTIIILQITLPMSNTHVTYLMQLIFIKYPHDGYFDLH